jgi:hypothetical protein
VLHHPAVRKLTERQWEVVCPHCGDTGETATELPPHLRPLRGPYTSFHDANLAAAEHQASVGDAAGA